MFVALGNDRPHILVELKDRVLDSIIAIAEGTSPESVLDKLYSQVLLLEKDLSNDVVALNWFNLLTGCFSMPPTPSSSLFPSTPSTGMSLSFELAPSLIFLQPIPICSMLNSKVGEMFLNLNGHLTVVQGWPLLPRHLVLWSYLVPLLFRKLPSWLTTLGMRA